MATVLSKPRIDWFLQPHLPDTLDLLSERDMVRYRLQRRLIGPAYQINSLLRHEHAVDAVIERSVATLKLLDGDEVDLKEWMHIIAVECLGAVVLSWSPGMLQRRSDSNSSVHSYQGWRRKSVFGLFPLVVKLTALSGLLDRFFLYCNLFGVRFKATPKFRSFFPVSD